MTTALIFLAGIMAVIIWWLARHTINVRPWQEVPAEESLSQTAGRSGSLEMPSVKVGLGAFLCVATSLFGLFVSAYYSRMVAPDWIHLPMPKLMWVNTAVLLASCVIVHWTLAAQRSGRTHQVKSGLVWGGVLTLIFLIGQLVVWQQLSVKGDIPAANAANAFLYLFTAAHGLHLLGGLWVWSKATIGALRNVKMRKLSMRIELCAVYWDYLFIVWLALFAVLLTS